MTRRQVFLLDLADVSLAQDYAQHHRPGAVPKQVIADIRAAGIENMEIFCLADRLVMITETADGNAPDIWEASAASRDWEARMDPFQRRITGSMSAPKWQAATSIFNLHNQDPKGH